MEYDYKGQLIVQHKCNVSYFLNGENGEPRGYSAKTIEEAKRKIDEFYEENGGFYDCDGYLYY